MTSFISANRNWPSPLLSASAMKVIAPPGPASKLRASSARSSMRISLLASRTISAEAARFSKASADRVKAAPGSSSPSMVGSCSSASPTSLSTMVIVSGSSSSVPQSPLGAVTSTDPVKASCRRPDTSTSPPLPLRAPPWAEIIPSKAVLSLAQITTCPPSPCSLALAVTTVFASTRVCAALGTGPSP